MYTRSISQTRPKTSIFLYTRHSENEEEIKQCYYGIPKGKQKVFAICIQKMSNALSFRPDYVFCYKFHLAANLMSFFIMNIFVKFYGWLLKERKS